MKNIIVTCILYSAIIVGTITGYLPSALAHAVQWKLAEGTPCAFAITYAEGEPMAYAAVKVFSPTDKKVEFLAGNADKNGVVAFVPTEAGEWTVEAHDGLGHKVSIPVVIAVDSLVASTHGQGGSAHLPMPLSIALGISVIGNVFFGLYWWQRKIKQ